MKQVYLKLVHFFSKTGGGNVHEPLFKKTEQIHSKTFILLGLHSLLVSMHKFITHKKIKRIICVGDSPSILLQIYQKYNPNVDILVLPISEISNASESMLYDKLKPLKKKLKSKIMWVDFVSSGNSFFKLRNVIMKLQKDTNFFIYGHDIVYHKDFKNIQTFSNVKFHKIEKTNVFYTFLTSIVGDSESHNIRCVERRTMTKKFKPMLHSIKSIPMKKSGSRCRSYANYLYKEMKKMNVSI